MAHRYGLRNDQWGRIKELLPGKEGDVGATAKNNRLFVEAVLYRYRAGVAWRNLPEDSYATYALEPQGSVGAGIQASGGRCRQ